MINEIEEVLIKGNLKFQKELTKKTEKFDFNIKLPKYPILILTCMDPRIDVHRIFGLKVGDVFVLRNAGNVVSPDILRSILVAIHENNIKYVIVLGHLDCGMTKIRMDNLQLKVLPKTIELIRKSALNFDAEFRDFFKPFVDSIKNIINQVKVLREFKGFPEHTKVIGMLYDINTGFIFDEELINKMKVEENFRYNYQTILKKKWLELNGYLNNLNSETVIQEKSILKNNVIKELDLKQESKQEPEMDVFENKISTVFENKKKFSIPKFDIPSICLPKVKIIIPNKYKFKKLQNNNNQSL